MLISSAIISKTLNNTSMSFKKKIGGLGLAVTGAYRVLVERPEAKKPLGRNTHRSEDNIKMDLQKVGWGQTQCVY